MCPAPCGSQKPRVISIQSADQIDVCCIVGCRHGNMGQELAKVLFDKLSSYAYIVLPTLDVFSLCAVK